MRHDFSTSLHPPVLLHALQIIYIAEILVPAGDFLHGY
jgi:hypothetical protein